jgi:hypothetical protein
MAPVHLVMKLSVFQVSFESAFCLLVVSIREVLRNPGISPNVLGHLQVMGAVYANVFVGKVPA